jgi:hypothetical protein
MRIIGINKSPAKIKNIGFRVYVLIFLSCLVWGCAQKNALEQAEEYTRQSETDYERAVNLYKGLISQGRDLARVHRQLGALYYNHGHFDEAIKELKKNNDRQAKKFLAISYYRLGNFTDALEVFSQEEAGDDEYLYYFGLTCERLNLFDRALVIYKKIKTPEFASLALGRINLIEKQVNLPSIKEINPQINKLLREAPHPEKYPQAGALILYCDEKVEITPQNTQVSTLHYLVKILNERGKESFSETHIDYDSTYEKVELVYARTIKPDGSVTEVGSRHIRDVSKYLNFPLYSNARVYIISFPEIVEGASIEYKAKIYRNQLITKKDFSMAYPVEASEPIIAANFNLVLPQDKTPKLKILNEKYNNFAATLSPQIQQQDSRLIYNWQFQELPQIIPEPNMPPGVEINPAILVSTFNSWQEVYEWWWGLSKDKIKADTAIKDKVAQLTKGLNSEEERARAIYNFCAQKIRYVAVEYGQAGYEPHSASDIFKNKYGDCKDQALLLVTMLKEAGLAAWCVLIPTKDCYNLNTDFPAMFFNHCIAAVAIKDKTIFLDPTAETCSFANLPIGDQGRKVLIIKDDGFQIQDTPFLPAETNLVRQKLAIKINLDESIVAEKAIFTYGAYDAAQRLWLLYTPPELIEQELKENLQNISIGAKLDRYLIKNLEDLNNPVVLSYNFKGPEYFTVAGNLWIMPQLASLDASIAAQDKRKYPIDFAMLDTIETISEITIPPQLAIRYLPASVSEESAWLKFNVEYNHKGNKIYFKQTRQLKNNRILEEEYPAFKNFLENLAKRVKQRIVLERVK